MTPPRNAPLEHLPPLVPPPRRRRDPPLPTDGPPPGPMAHPLQAKGADLLPAMPVVYPDAQEPLPDSRITHPAAEPSVQPGGRGRGAQEQWQDQGQGQGLWQGQGQGPGLGQGQVQGQRQGQEQVKEREGGRYRRSSSVDNDVSHRPPKPSGNSRSQTPPVYPSGAQRGGTSSSPLRSAKPAVPAAHPWGPGAKPRAGGHTGLPAVPRSVTQVPSEIDSEPPVPIARHRSVTGHETGSRQAAVEAYPRSTSAESAGGSGGRGAEGHGHGHNGAARGALGLQEMRPRVGSAREYHDRIAAEDRFAREVGSKSMGHMSSHVSSRRHHAPEGAPQRQIAGPGDEKRSPRGGPTSAQKLALFGMCVVPSQGATISSETEWEEPTGSGGREPGSSAAPAPPGGSAKPPLMLELESAIREEALEARAGRPVPPQGMTAPTGNPHPRSTSPGGSTGGSVGPSASSRGPTGGGSSVSKKHGGLPRARRSRSSEEADLGLPLEPAAIAALVRAHQEPAPGHAEATKEPPLSPPPLSPVQPPGSSESTSEPQSRSASSPKPTDPSSTLGGGEDSKREGGGREGGQRERGVVRRYSAEPEGRSPRSFQAPKGEKSWAKGIGDAANRLLGHAPLPRAVTGPNPGLPVAPLISEAPCVSEPQPAKPLTGILKHGGARGSQSVPKSASSGTPVQAPPGVRGKPPTSPTGPPMSFSVASTLHPQEQHQQHQQCHQYPHQHGAAPQSPRDQWPYDQRPPPVRRRSTSPFQSRQAQDPHSPVSPGPDPVVTIMMQGDARLAAMHRGEQGDLPHESPPPRVRRHATGPLPQRRPTSFDGEVAQARQGQDRELSAGRAPPDPGQAGMRGVVEVYQGMPISFPQAFFADPGGSAAAPGAGRGPGAGGAGSRPAGRAPQAMARSQSSQAGPVPVRSRSPFSQRAASVGVPGERVAHPAGVPGGGPHPAVPPLGAPLGPGPSAAHHRYTSPQSRPQRRGYHSGPLPGPPQFPPPPQQWDQNGGRSQGGPAVFHGAMNPSLPPLQQHPQFPEQGQDPGHHQPAQQNGAPQYQQHPHHPHQNQQQEYHHQQQPQQHHQQQHPQLLRRSISRDEDPERVGSPMHILRPAPLVLPLSTSEALAHSPSPVAPPVYPTLPSPGPMPYADFQDPGEPGLTAGKPQVVQGPVGGGQLGLPVAQVVASPQAQTTSPHPAEPQMQGRHPQAQAALHHSDSGRHQHSPLQGQDQEQRQGQGDGFGVPRSSTGGRPMPPVHRQGQQGRPPLQWGPGQGGTSPRDARHPGTSPVSPQWGLGTLPVYPPRPGSISPAGASMPGQRSQSPSPRVEVSGAAPAGRNSEMNGLEGRRDGAGAPLRQGVKTGSSRPPHVPRSTTGGAGLPVPTTGGPGVRRSATGDALSQPLFPSAPTPQGPDSLRHTSGVPPNAPSDSEAEDVPFCWPAGAGIAPPGHASGPALGPAGAAVAGSHVGPGGASGHRAVGAGGPRGGSEGARNGIPGAAPLLVSEDGAPGALEAEPEAGDADGRTLLCLPVAPVVAPVVPPVVSPVAASGAPGQPAGARTTEGTAKRPFAVPATGWRPPGVQPGIAPAVIKRLMARPATAASEQSSGETLDAEVAEEQGEDGQRGEGRGAEEGKRNGEGKARGKGRGQRQELGGRAEQGGEQGREAEKDKEGEGEIEEEAGEEAETEAEEAEAVLGVPLSQQLGGPGAGAQPLMRWASGRTIDGESTDVSGAGDNDDDAPPGSPLLKASASGATLDAEAAESGADEDLEVLMEAMGISDADDPSIPTASIVQARPGLVLPGPKGAPSAAGQARPGIGLPGTAGGGPSVGPHMAGNARAGSPVGPRRGVPAASREDPTDRRIQRVWTPARPAQPGEGWDEGDEGEEGAQAGEDAEGLRSFESGVLAVPQVGPRGRGHGAEVLKQGDQLQDGARRAAVVPWLEEAVVEGEEGALEEGSRRARDLGSASGFPAAPQRRAASERTRRVRWDDNVQILDGRHKSPMELRGSKPARASQDGKSGTGTGAGTVGAPSKLTKGAKAGGSLAWATDGSGKAGAAGAPRSSSTQEGEGGPSPASQLLAWDDVLLGSHGRRGKGAGAGGAGAEAASSGAPPKPWKAPLQPGVAAKNNPRKAGSAESIPLVGSSSPQDWSPNTSQRNSPSPPLPGSRVVRKVGSSDSTNSFSSRPGDGDGDTEASCEIFLYGK